SGKVRNKHVSEHMDSVLFFFSSRRRHTRFDCDWSSDVCSSDLPDLAAFSEKGMASAATGQEQLLSFVGTSGALPDRFTQSHDLRSEERRVGKEWRAGRGWGAEKEEERGVVDRLVGRVRQRLGGS